MLYSKYSPELNNATHGDKLNTAVILQLASGEQVD